jgi:hypothetical protein
MNIEILKVSLAPWLRVDTWHTFHPCDDERFHRALKSAFDSLGTPIEFDDFKEAMEQLAKEHHPNFQASYRDELVEKFAQRAENIGSYLHDNAI